MQRGTNGRTRARWKQGGAGGIQGVLAGIDGGPMVQNFLYFCDAFFGGVSSVGRASAWHAEGQRFESATLHGGLAQLVERQHGMLEVSGSNPLPSTGG